MSPFITATASSLWLTLGTCPWFCHFHAVIYLNASIQPVTCWPWLPTRAPLSEDEPAYCRRSFLRTQYFVEWLCSGGVFLNLPHGLWQLMTFQYKYSQATISVSLSLHFSGLSFQKRHCCAAWTFNSLKKLSKYFPESSSVSQSRQQWREFSASPAVVFI
jgi:hypothetical protein